MFIIGGNIYGVLNPMILSLSNMPTHAASRLYTCSYLGETIPPLNIMLAMFYRYTIVTMLDCSNDPILQYSIVIVLCCPKDFVGLLFLSHIGILLNEVVYHIFLKNKLAKQL